MQNIQAPAGEYIFPWHKMCYVREYRVDIFSSFVILYFSNQQSCSACEVESWCLHRATLIAAWIEFLARNFVCVRFCLFTAGSEFGLCTACAYYGDKKQHDERIFLQSFGLPLNCVSLSGNALPSTTNAKYDWKQLWDLLVVSQVVLFLFHCQGLQKWKYMNDSKKKETIDEVEW